MTELADTKALLARSDNQIDRTRYDAAISALDRDETALAETLLPDLPQNAARNEAKRHAKRGEIAQSRVNWRAAATHYARAAQQDPQRHTLHKARKFAWLRGDYPAARHFSEDLLRRARAGDTRENLSVALNEHALTLKAAGADADAEPLIREALDIGRETLGASHPDTAMNLNNLAGLLNDTGHPYDATPPYLDALEILRTTLGDDHPRTRRVAQNALTQMRDHAPDHPDLPRLLAAFG